MACAAGGLHAMENTMHIRRIGQVVDLSENGLTTETTVSE